MTETQRNDLRSYGLSACITMFMTVIGGFVFHALVPQVPIYMFAVSYGIPFGFIMPLFGGSIVPKIRFRSFMATIAARTVAWGVGISLAFAISLCTLLPWSMGKSLLDPQVRSAVESVFTSPQLVGSAFVSLLVVFVIGSIYQISRKLGPGVLIHWITGYYHNPREEERVFMFLDMKDSTTLAERLGHLRFSALVRDFFQDMTSPVIETRGEVDHYVGDEAILTWPTVRGVNKANCLRCFFLMKEVVLTRSDHYLKEYGVVPGFKAGAHCGRVVTTEVGEIKSEIVFHGDVLNTAARIQGLCNGLDAELLISGELAAKLVDLDGLSVTSLGPVQLRGKEHEVELFRVDLAADLVPGTVATEAKAIENGV